MKKTLLITIGILLIAGTVWAEDFDKENLISTSTETTSSTTTEYSDIARPMSDLDIELEKIKSNPSKVNWIIVELYSQDLNQRSYKYSLWTVIPSEDRIPLLERKMYLIGFNRAMLQCNGNQKLIDILNSTTYGVKIKTAVKEFQNTYYDIYGEMPSLAIVDSDRIKAKLLGKY